VELTRDRPADDVACGAESNVGYMLLGLGESQEGSEHLTPSFPSYVSGHATQSAAADAALTAMLGPVAFTDTTHRDHGLTPAQAPRRFSSFEEAAAEAAVSRLYGGIHYRFDNEDGLTTGQCIGQAIVDRVHFGQERGRR
jgi:hypothetical protein